MFSDYATKPPAESQISKEQDYVTCCPVELWTPTSFFCDFFDLSLSLERLMSMEFLQHVASLLDTLIQTRRAINPLAKMDCAPKVLTHHPQCFRCVLDFLLLSQGLLSG